MGKDKQIGKESKKHDLSKKADCINDDKIFNKKKVIILATLVVLIFVFLFWWFNRKFNVTIKYNNGTEDSLVVVKYLKKVEKENFKEDLTLDGYTFLGYFETYYLSEEKVQQINNEVTKEDTICKQGFKLNFEKTKCISEKKFDYEKTKIKKDTTIEGLWSKNSVEESKVIEKQQEPRKVVPQIDTGTVSLSANNQCIVGTESVKIIAKVSTNALNKNVNWSFPECFTYNEESNTVATISRFYGRNSCSSNEGLNPKVTVKLNNGASDSLTFTYEDILSVEVYDGSTKIQPSSDGYYGSNIKIVTNIDSKFDVSPNYVKDKTNNSVTIMNSSDATIKISTTCGQSKTIKIYAVIN